MGGTFDPIHFGHLRTALDLREHFPDAQLRFVPAAQPPHRDEPGADAIHRAHMVELAIAGIDDCVCDRRELERQGPSYTYDTLASLRSELGDEVALVLVMGSDAIAGIVDWYRYDDLLDLAHILVQARPGWPLPGSGPVADLLRDRRTGIDAISQTPNGAIAFIEERQLEISATEIRGLCQAGKSASYLLPASVLSYIKDQSLYSG